MWWAQSCETFQYEVKGMKEEPSLEIFIFLVTSAETK